MENVSTLKYMQIYNELRSEILMGEYALNNLIPTENQLMEEYNAGRNTVRHAIGLLKEDGLVRAVRGSGVTVIYDGSNRFEDRTKRKMSEGGSLSTVEFCVDVEHIRITPNAVDMVSAPADAAAALGLIPGTQVYRNQRVWKVNGLPYTYMVQYLHPVLLDGFMDHASEETGLYTLAHKYWGLTDLSTREILTCKNAEFKEAAILNVEPGKAVLHLIRTADSNQGHFEYTEMFVNPELQRYVLSVDEIAIRE